MLLLFYSCLLLGISRETSASASLLKAHAMFSDGLVLQTIDDHGPGSSLTGTSAPADHVTLSIDGKEIGNALADNSGKWDIPVRMTSSGPHIFTLRGNKTQNIIIAKDVYIGDVFICSGQSNMVFPVGSGNDYEHGVGGQSIEDAVQVAKGATNTKFRAWLVPAVKKGATETMMDAQSRHPGEVSLGGLFELAGEGAALTNLSGACNLTTQCDSAQPGQPPPDCAAVCDTGSDLAHTWMTVTPHTVRPISAVCYTAIQSAMLKWKDDRAVGVVLAYVGGTPVGAWANNARADSTCHVTPSGPANVPCNPAQAACPGTLYNEFIAPVFASGNKFRSALWYQGEANSDEGYARSREEYACQFKLLINSWRSALSYTLPFVWVLLHPWGGGGGAGHAMAPSPQAAIRLAQSDVAESGLNAVGMVNNMDGCQSDYDSQKKGKAQSCNLHPGYKSVIGGRLGAKILSVAFGAEDGSPNPLFAAAEKQISTDGKMVTVTFKMKPGPGTKALQLKPIHDAKSVWLGRGCSYTNGMVIMNASFHNGGSGVINGTAKVIGSDVVATFTSPFHDADGNPVGTNAVAVHGAAYAMQPVLPCVVANGYGEPLSPIVVTFPAWQSALIGYSNDIIV